MGRSESSRRGRKLRVSKKPEADVQEEAEVLAPVAPKPESSKRSSSARRGRRSSKRNPRQVQQAVAYMGEEVTDEQAAAGGDDAAAPAGDDAPAEPTQTQKDVAEAIDAKADEIDKQVEAGNFQSDLINVDEDDQKEIAEKAFKKTAVDARGKIHEFANSVEDMAGLILNDALKNKAGRAGALQARMTLLTRLWQFRDTSDCEDDYNMEEWQAAMRGLATIQRKLRSLDGKISSLMLGGEMSSSDTDGDGEKQNMTNLKRARQNLRYALGEGTVAA